MGKLSPKISVGMPVYNGEPYIDKAIQSIINQTFENFEFIISDNASTDRTEDICRRYASKDKRIIYTRNSKNIGAALNYNKVFKLSSAPYFRWFNADDISALTIHERCIEVMEANPEAVLCSGKTSIIDDCGKTIENCDDHLELLQEKPSERFIKYFDLIGLTNCVYGLMRAPAVSKTNLLGDGSYPAGDINFVAELTLHGKFIEIPETLFYRRMHPQASSWARDSDTIQQKFWQGNNNSFTLPTFKRFFAFLKAASRAPINKREKLKLQIFILRQMIWTRRDLIEEIYGYFRKKC